MKLLVDKKNCICKYFISSLLFRLSSCLYFSFHIFVMNPKVIIQSTPVIADTLEGDLVSVTARVRYSRLRNETYRFFYDM